MMLRDKVPAEAEMFGLKIRQLVSPVYPHRFPLFDSWVQREAAARFPNENENWNARLGVVATLGFLGLLLFLFVPDRPLAGAWAPVRAGSRLTLAALLLATVGGFGSLFSLFVSPDIRAYNRISPFIAFFSLLAVAVALDVLFKTRRSRIAAALVVLGIGVADQGESARRLNRQYDGIAKELGDLETFVDTLERSLPRDAMVFQLPFRTYMNEGDEGRMKAYDHFKPYLVSKSLRFSYPALSNEQVQWQRAAARLELRALTSHLYDHGFSAILIDRFGYDDDGKAVTDALLRVVGADGILAKSDRFVAVDITSLANYPVAPESVGNPERIALTLSLTPCPGVRTTVVSVEDQVDQIGETHAPFGDAGALIHSAQDAKVSGWAIDRPGAALAGGVDVVIDRMIFPSTYGTYRKDVADYFGRPQYRGSGFTATIPPRALQVGEHWLSLRVVSADLRCYYQSPPVRIMVD
jgi:phosphoglycerol transferase